MRAITYGIDAVCQACARCQRFDDKLDSGGVQRALLFFS